MNGLGIVVLILGTWSRIYRALNVTFEARESRMMRETCVRRNRKVPPWLEQLVRAIRLPFGNGARPAVVTREIRAKCHPIDLELFTRVSFGDRKGGKSIYNFACAPIYFSTNYKFWSRVAGLCFLWVVAVVVDFLFRRKNFTYVLEFLPVEKTVPYMRTVRFGFNLEYVVWSGS
jgi:hypothetical protein